MWQVILCLLALTLAGCGGFQAQRVDRSESDKRALEITDEWVMGDTEKAVGNTLKQIASHKGFARYLKRLGRSPKLFVADIQNRTGEPYFPVDDFNDELLNEFSASGDYILIDEAARAPILKEIQYQNDGMVRPADIKNVGHQSGADLMVFGAIRMVPRSREGQTIKEYSINIRMTDITQGVEVLRTRVKESKHSQQSRFGW